MNSVPDSSDQGRHAIDLNADVGEGFGRWTLGDDEALLAIITSANVACGFHAGDATIMRRVCRWAREQSVAVGAQVSYRDLAGFGRRRIAMPSVELTNDVVYQIGGLDGCARAEGVAVSYVKPHGALNNASATDTDQALAIVDAVLAYDPMLPVLVLPGSQLEIQAQAAGLRTVAEAYPDRAYESDGQLLSRALPGAVLDDVTAITRRAVELACNASVSSIDGSRLTVRAESLCLHGDNPAAVASARSIASALREHGVALASFVTSP